MDVSELRSIKDFAWQTSAFGPIDAQWVSLAVANLPGSVSWWLTDACLCANLSRQGFKPSVNVAPNLIFS
jgi:hypothetical protein